MRYGHQIVIKNYKRFGSQKVLQLETAAGSLISLTEKVDIINVPRRRFIPTKTCSDLVLIISDCYRWNKCTGMLELDPSVKEIPKLSLPEEFSKLDVLLAHSPFPLGLKSLTSLSIIGDVYFSRGVTFRGNVEITATDGKPLIVPENALLSNVKITGYLMCNKLSDEGKGLDSHYSSPLSSDSLKPITDTM